MAKGLAKPSATFLILATSLWYGCGGKASLEAEEGYVGGRSGQSGQAGQASDTPTPAKHVSECESLCARASEVGCSAGDASCVMVCATVTGFPNCQAQIENWLACAKTSEITCDESGNLTFVACENQLTQAGLCAITTPPPAAVAQSCSDYCTQVEAAGCSLSTPYGECRDVCGLAGTSVSTCQSGYVDWLACAAASGAVCDETGQINSSICLPQQAVWLGCVFSTVGAATLATGAGGATAI